jgi:hypothetical protein
LQASGEEMLRQGRYAEVEKTFQMALGKVENSSATDLRRLQSMGSLAIAFQQQGLLSQADALGTQVLDLSEKHPDPDLMEME